MLHSQFGGDKIELSVVQTYCNWTEEMDFTAGMGNLLPVLQVEVGGPMGYVPYKSAAGIPISQQVYLIQVHSLSLQSPTSCLLEVHTY